jgi:ribosome recycling factor
MSDIINKHKPEAEKIISFFEQEVGKLRLGRAAPSLVEGVQVEAYGVYTPLVHLASINVTDPKTLTIQSWDKSQIKAIEKALAGTDVGSVSVDGDLVRVTMASLTEETRREVVKKLHVKSEEAKVSFKTLREDIKQSIIEAEHAKTVSQDEKFAFLDELEDFIKDYQEKIKNITSLKEADIMKI